MAHLIPLTGTARNLVSTCAAILMLTPVAMSPAALVELIQSLFDLTPTEAHVARGLAAGDTVADIARHRAVSRETVRTHVQHVLAKTGCRRQGEVALLLGGIAPPSLKE